jgi:serine/threonine protein kinase/Tol biopolymer transport system component
VVAPRNGGDWRTVTPERWRRINELFQSAVAQRCEHRAAYLAGACDGDDDLRHEVASLVASFEDGEDFLETSIAEAATEHFADDPSPARQGRRLGQYEILSLLGEGGMGSVYLARDTKLGRKAALKLLPSDFTADVEWLRRFTLEARAASSLNHPNILTIYDIAEAVGTHYIAAEYIEGETLRQRMARGTMSVGEALTIAVQIAEGLSAAHAAGIVHRDVKPDNVMLRPDGYVKVLDFGVAKTIKTSTIATPVSGARTAPVTPTSGSLMGTIRYMSPEQALGRTIDARTDIFSFGLVLYEMLSGRHPFAGGSDLDVLHAIVHGPPEPLPDTVSPSLHRIVETALKKDPGQRYHSMTEIVVDLRASADGLQTSPSHSKRTARWLAVATIASVLAAVGALVPALFRRAAVPTHREYTPLTNFADAATSPAVSPDGRMLTFIRGESTFFGPGQIYLKRLPHGEPIQLTHDDVDKMDPKFSLDGTRITYTAFTATGFDTWVVPASGVEAPRLFLTNADGLTWIDVAPGQPHLLFSEGTGHNVQMGIVTSNESRGQHRVVYMPSEVGMAHRSHLSPDKKNVLVSGQMTYYSWLPCRVVPYDGSSSGRTVGPVPSQCTHATWSPDGKWMYFTANAGSGFHIWRQHFPNGPPEQVTSGITEEEGVEFAPDGRSFVTSIGTRQSTVWVHDSRGDRQITSEGYALLPTFSANAKKLFYMTKAGAIGSFVSGALWVVNLESGARERLLSDFLMKHYDVSADGSRVVFVGAGETEHSPVLIAAVDGRSPPRQLTDKDGLAAFFGPKDDIIFASNETEGHFLYRVPQDGSTVRKLRQVFNVFSVSPDGQWVSAWSPPNPPNSVSLLPTSGGSPILVCEACYIGGTFESGLSPPPVSWSHDAKFVYVKFNRSTYAVPLRAGQMLPAIPAAGFGSEQEVARLPGAVRIADTVMFTGPSPSMYASTKVATQRNIYLVPVP